MKKFKSMMKRAKALIAAAAVAVTTAVCSVVASAETVEAPANNLADVISAAGDQITESFSTMIATTIPIIIGIMVSGLGIYAIILLIKLAKKIFGKVAG